jgi:hypothetical protein
VKQGTETLFSQVPAILRLSGARSSPKFRADFDSACRSETHRLPLDSGAAQLNSLLRIWTSYPQGAERSYRLGCLIINLKSDVALYLRTGTSYGSGNLWKVGVGGKLQ